MLYQISGYSLALKNWIEQFFLRHQIQYELQSHASGYVFDIQTTLFKETFLEFLSRSNLPSADLEFCLQVSW